MSESAASTRMWRMSVAVSMAAVASDGIGSPAAGLSPAALHAVAATTATARARAVVRDMTGRPQNGKEDDDCVEYGSARTAGQGAFTRSTTNRMAWTTSSGSSRWIAWPLFVVTMWMPLLERRAERGRIRAVEHAPSLHLLLVGTVDEHEAGDIGGIERRVQAREDAAIRTGDEHDRHLHVELLEQRMQLGRGIARGVPLRAGLRLAEPGPRVGDHRGEPGRRWNDRRPVVELAAESGFEHDGRAGGAGAEHFEAVAADVDELARLRGYNDGERCRDEREQDRSADHAPVTAA
jgi:hypothetical protein